MLMGEHAVLYGQPALVCALDSRIEITFTLRNDRLVKVNSALAEYQSSLDRLDQDPRLEFVIAAIEAYQGRLQTGFECSIHATFSSTIGLGSSAAVTAAMVKGLQHLVGVESDLKDDFRQGLAIIHKVQQGRGSGADLAATLKGGVICFQPEPLEISSVSCPENIVFSLFYSGYKMKTPEVLAWVEEQWRHQRELRSALYQLMGSTCRASMEALQQTDLKEFGRLMNCYQGLMDSLGVCDATLASMIYSLRDDERVYGAKISGSGLGDCVLTLGTETPNHLTKYAGLTVHPAKSGVLIETL